RQHSGKNECSQRRIRYRIQPAVDPITKPQFINDKCGNDAWNHGYKRHADNNHPNHACSSFNKKTPLSPPKTVPSTIAQPELRNRLNKLFTSMAITAIKPTRNSFL